MKLLMPPAKSFAMAILTMRAMLWRNGSLKLHAWVNATLCAFETWHSRL